MASRILYLRVSYESLRRREYVRYLTVMLKHRAYLRRKFHLDYTIGHLRLMIVRALRQKRVLIKIIKELSSIDCCEMQSLYNSEN